MDGTTLFLLVLVALWMTNRNQQRKRIQLLGQHLRPLQVERLMETLMDGYLRAAGETDAARQQQIWELLGRTEEQLLDQLRRFSRSFATAPEPDTRLSLLPMSLPYAHVLFKRQIADMRKLLSLHADGLETVLTRTDLEPKARAFMASAELLLLQHSCHWFCKSFTVASARLLARHKTDYQQVLASVSEFTRTAYATLVRR